MDHGRHESIEKYGIKMFHYHYKEINSQSQIISVFTISKTKADPKDYFEVSLIARENIKPLTLPGRKIVPCDNLTKDY
jgi:hypothetical protein